MKPMQLGLYYKSKDKNKRIKTCNREKHNIQWKTKN